MNILREYTFDYVRRNKKTSIAIMVAILISTILITSFSGFCYNLWSNSINNIINSGGDWHGWIREEIKAEKLKYIFSHPNVTDIMLKGNWDVAKINDNSRRPFFIMRGANKAYWKNMSESRKIIKGRVPTKKSEIVVSKQYYYEHPELKIGDTITLQVGDRIYNQNKLKPTNMWEEGETFDVSNTEKFTLVGVLDLTTSSTTPGYYALSYIDNEDIKPEHKVTVYMKFKNPRKIYNDLPQIAESIGLKKDQYGAYPIRYNENLLNKYLILNPNIFTNFHIADLLSIVALVFFIILIIALFVMVIHNAFAMSANSRIRQLGMLKSIGATPKQITQSVIFEAMVLSIIPVPVGIFTSNMINKLLFEKLKMINVENDYTIKYVFDIRVIIISVIVTLITVWLSAKIPAKKIAKCSPIRAIRQGEMSELTKEKKHSIISKIFGVEGELAINSLKAYKKSYKTSIVSLTLSFLLLSCFPNLIAINNSPVGLLSNEEYKDIYIEITDGKPVDSQFIQQIRNTDNVKDALFLSDILCTTWVNKDKQSDELLKIGGLERVASGYKYPVEKQGDKFQIQTRITAIDDEAFNKYCNDIGVDSKQFYDPNNPKSIIINSLRDDVNSTQREQIRIPYLNIKNGEKITSCERLFYDDEKDYTFDLEVGFVTDIFPTNERTTNGYRLFQVIPMSIYENIVKNFYEEREAGANKAYVYIETENEDDLLKTYQEIQKLTDIRYGSGDYASTNKIEKKQKRDLNIKLIMTCIYSIAALVSVIGIANAYSTVSGNMQQRSREFAMLKSVGLTPKGLNKILTLEALFFGLTPIVFALPISLVVLIIFLKVAGMTFIEFIPYLPVMPVLIFVLIILGFIGLAYFISARKMKNNSIIEVIKNETI